MASASSAMVGVDTIIHLAADTGVLTSISEPEHNFRVNAFGTFQLLQIARKSGVRRVLNASTGGAILGEVTPPVHEGMVPRPLAPYGASKLAAEGYCSAFSGAYALQTLSLRFSNIYGPGSWHKGSVVAHFFKGILNLQELIVYGDGTQARDFLFVGDLIEGICSAIESEVIGVVQLGSGRPTTIDELIVEIRSAVDGEFVVRARYEDFREGEIHTTWCDISKARRELGFDPATPLASGLRETLNWFRVTRGSGQEGA